MQDTIKEGSAVSYLFKRLEDLPPGNTMLLTKPDGLSYIIMAEDDFDHICQLAGLEYTPPTGESVSIVGRKADKKNGAT
jgi:hypothetical protein